MKTKVNFMKKSLPGLMLMWVIVFFAFGNSAQATHVDLYLDSVTPNSKHHFCKTTVDTVILHKLSGTTVTNWSCYIPPYLFPTDSLVIPNDYNTAYPGGASGGVSYYYTSGNAISIYIFFDAPAVSPGITNQVICGKNPILLDALNTGVGGYLWSTGDTTKTITTDSTGLYWISIFSACGSPIINTFSLTFVSPQPNIQVVTFDTATQRNMLLWDGVDPQSDSVYIYKRAPSNAMEPIDTVLFSTGNYIDLGSNPPSDQAEYALVIKDTCGNVSDTSLHHKTIWLQISSYSTDVYFHYTLYGGLHVSTYTLRGIKTTGEIDSLKEVAATFQDFSLPLIVAQDYVKFYMDFPVSLGSKAILYVRSNTITGQSGINELLQSLTKVYPNPTSDVLNIELPTEADIQLQNCLGQIILRKHSNLNDQLSMTKLSSGIYFLKIQITPDIYTVRKIIKQ